MKFFVGVCCFFSVACWSLFGYYHQASNASDTSLTSEGVEALSRTETVKPVCYTWAHLACGDYVYYKGQINYIANGQYSGFCWENENASRGYHEHSCSSCNDNG